MIVSVIVWTLVFAAASGDSSASSKDMRMVPAFPGAEGAGAFTKGGRGGRVIAVTTLADYRPGREPQVPGSLRAAVNAKGPRIVIFRVAGNIELKEDLYIQEPFLTIAAQSAPGDGVCLKGSSVVIAAPEVVVRYLRVRPGDIQKRELDCISSISRQVILDHCSASWGIDETISTNGNSANVTVQWCIIAESLNHSVHHKGSHGYGSLISGSGEITYHHNVYAYHRSRNPRPGDVRLDFRNNLVFGWGDRAGYNGNEKLQMNYVGNYLKPLAYSKRADIAFAPGGLSGRIYVEGNHLVGNDERSKNNWLLIRTPDNVDPAELEKTVRAAHPFSTSHVTTESAEEAYQHILSDVGATRPARDSADTRLIQQIESGTGRLIDSQDEVGGWPNLTIGDAPFDSDKDGMPNWWETEHKLDPLHPTDSADTDNDGFTDIEEYLNATDPHVAEKWIDPPVVSSSAGQFFTGDTTVTIGCATPDADIHYTLDESIPIRSSPLYSAPIELKESKVVRVVAFRGEEASYVMSTPLTQLSFHDATSVISPIAGLVYEYGETPGDKAAPLGESFAVKTRGIAKEVTPAVREREDSFALRFAGYFSAPKDGIYTFSLCCSPRGRLYLGKNLLVENEGRKCVHEGTVALRQGFHPIEFQINYPKNENKTLEVHVEGPEMPKHPLGGDLLFHAD